MSNNHYIIHKDTCALIPAREIEYGSVVIEHENMKKVSGIPFDIIKESCTHYWSDYEGRRNAVIQKLGYQQKTPILLSIQHKLCFFPTHSPLHMDNCWINFNQINRWAEVPSREQSSSRQIEVVFKNKEKIRLCISTHSFRTQFDRAFTVMYESGMIK